MPQIYFKANPDLAKIFALFDLFAVRGHKLFAHPLIVDDPEKALKSPNIIDELHFHQRMDNYARDIVEFLRIQANKCSIYNSPKL